MLHAGVPRLIAAGVHLPGLLARELVAHASGDSVDAVLAMLQAGWAAQRPGWGWPAGVDPLEGWIASA